MSIKNIIEEILKNIHISKSNQLHFDNSFHLENAYFTNSINLKMIKNINSIKEYIYLNFYLNVTQYIEYSFDKKTFLKELKKANSSLSKFHRNWKIEHINLDGSVIVNKSNKRLQLKPGQYLQEKYENKYPYLGQKIFFYTSNEFIDDEGKFYYINSNNIEQTFPDHLIRFYFNISIHATSHLIFFLTSIANKKKIPFRLKTLTNPNDYNRADSVVLYLDKRYFYDFKPILKGIINEINSYLKAETPLFTLKLYDGIGFAENPPNPNESFGMSRCRLIAEGIWQAHENKLPKSEWANFVINYIENQGYDLEKFYLNPNSRFPYDFN